MGRSSLLSGRPNEAKSVSLRGGAGADGDIVAFNGIVMGGREDGGKTRVGAVNPESNGLRN
jgi:hypothetical protein